MPRTRRDPPSRRFVAAALRALALAAGLWLASGGLALASRPPWAQDRSKPVYPEILLGAKDVARLGARAQLLDARPAALFETGRLPGAISLDPGRLPREPGRLAAALGASGVRGDKLLVCYADAAHQAAAGELFWLLEVAGTRSARVLNGGLEAWRAAGGRVERPLGAPPAARFPSRPDTSRFADLAYVRAVYGVAGFEILESRSEAEWERGHIPHALAFPVDSLRAPGGGLRSAPELRAAFAAFGPRPRDFVNLGDEFVICMDGGQADAPSLYVAARAAGIGRVRGFAGGFASWRARPDAPVVRIVDAAEVKAKMSGATWWQRVRGQTKPKALLFDVRIERDYEVGHLPGAVALPSHRFDDELEAVIEQRWPGIDRATTPVLFYCYGPDCIRSRVCSSIAARHGFHNLLWFRDGIDGWYAAGETLVRGE